MNLTHPFTCAGICISTVSVPVTQLHSASTPLFPMNSVIKFTILQNVSFSGMHVFHFDRNACTQMTFDELNI